MTVTIGRKLSALALCLLSTWPVHSAAAEDPSDAGNRFDLQLRNSISLQSPLLLETGRLFPQPRDASTTAAAPTEQNIPTSPTKEGAGMQKHGQAEPPKADRADCLVRLKNLIEELDRTLDSNPPSIEPIRSLLKEYFPVQQCDIQAALQICRSSKYFVDIYEYPHVYLCHFDSNKLSTHLGIKVQFGLLRASGNSSLPFTIVKQ